MEKKFKQFTCIDRWDDNAKYFDELADYIKTGEFTNVIIEMLSWAESNLDAYNYGDVINGKANNIGEVVVYEHEPFILTASETTITLFVSDDDQMVLNSLWTTMDDKAATPLRNSDRLKQEVIDTNGE